MKTEFEDSKKDKLIKLMQEQLLTLVALRLKDRELFPQMVEEARVIIRGLKQSNS